MKDQRGINIIAITLYLGGLHLYFITGCSAQFGTINMDIVLGDSHGQGEEPRHKDRSSAPVSACDTNEIVYRGTDNRWYDKPETPFSAGQDGYNMRSGGTLPGVKSGKNYATGGENTPGGLLTHCPDARTIRCDPHTNLFHAHNYLSIAYTEETYTKYMKNLFNYTKPMAAIHCSEYARISAYDQTDPSNPPSGYTSGVEPTSRSKLIFHSMQIFGEVTSPTDSTGGTSPTKPCDTFWGDGVYGSDSFKQAPRKNPPFFCVYTPSVYNTYPTDSTSCAAFTTAGGSGDQKKNGDYLVNPNCGAQPMPNGTIDNSDFFQVWMAPIQWEDRYNWEALFARSPEMTGLGYPGLVNQLTERFVDCDKAVAGRILYDEGVQLHNQYAHLCLPHKKRTDRHPLLTGYRVHTTCNVVRQLECAPPTGSTMVNEGTECFCSFPYTSGILPQSRDPWDIYCYAGQGSSISIEQPGATNQQAHKKTLWGNDYTITPQMVNEMHAIKIQTDNQWTFYDWTPVFTSPPYSISCPPVDYLFIEQLTGGNWAIRSVIQRARYDEHLGDIAPFIEPLYAWEAEWPSIDMPLPDGPMLRPPSPDSIAAQRPMTSSSDPSTGYKKILSDNAAFKDYIVSAEFKGLELVTRRDREGSSKTLLVDPNAVASASAEHPFLCGLSESGRHYGTDHAPFLFWERGEALTCNYDIRMYYEEKTVIHTMQGDQIVATPVSHSSTIALKYNPTFFSSSFKNNIYYLAAPAHDTVVEYVHVDDPESEVLNHHFCRSGTGAVSDCIVRTTQNIQGEAAYNARSSYVRHGGLQRELVENGYHFKFSPFFSDGICTTPSIQSGMRWYDIQTLGLPPSCYEPDSNLVNDWYTNRFHNIVHKEETWRRQLKRISEDYSGTDDTSARRRIPRDYRSHPYNHTEHSPFIRRSVLYHPLSISIPSALAPPTLNQCPSISTSAFYSRVAHNSTFESCFSNPLNTPLAHECRARMLTCPRAENIRFVGEDGFRVMGEEGHAWSFTHLEHALSMFIRNKNIPPAFLPFPEAWTRENLYSSTAPPMGAMDVDPTSIRFMAAYEVPRHHCKYMFHSLGSTPIPTMGEGSGGGGSGIPYHTMPHFFYMSPRVRDITGLAKYSCRRYVSDWNMSAGEKECFIELPEVSFPSLGSFLNTIPTLLLCNISGDTAATPPLTFYEIYAMFVALGGDSIFPSVDQVAREYEKIIIHNIKYHPIAHSEMVHTKYCSSLYSRDCPFMSPIIPSTITPFVSYGP
jgi:hypothetical protein